MGHPQIIMKGQDCVPVVNRPLELINPYEVQTVKIEHVGDHTIYRYAQRCGDILNNNERERMNGTNDNAKEFRKTASVPEVTWILWESLGITNNHVELRKALERNKEFKTTDKKLI